jgi:hypothetical protein
VSRHKVISAEIRIEVNRQLKASTNLESSDARYFLLRRPVRRPASRRYWHPGSLLFPCDFCSKARPVPNSTIGGNYLRNLEIR